MRTPLLQMLGCVLALHLFAAEALTQSIQPVSRSEIFELRIEGNRFVSEQKIRRIIRFKEGDRYSDQAVSEALRRLYATKEFEDARAYKDVQGSGVILTIRVKEFPRIDNVRYEGNKKIKDDDLSEKTTVKAGDFVRPSLLRGDFAAIEEMYRDKGYYRIEVTNRIVREQEKKSKRPQTVLIYDIKEGEKVSVAHIDFFGNRSVDSDDIRGSMEAKQDGWFSNSDFKPKLLAEDRARIMELYRNNGFLDAAVVDQELHFSEDGKDLDIFITIREGTQYKIGDVTWTGNEVFPDNRIFPLISMRTGDVFDDSEFSEIQFNLNSLYWDRGYIYNSISPNKTVRRDVIDVEFEIAEGEPAHINEINIAGNTKTSEEVIRRQLVVNPGDIFRRPMLIRSLREVFNLGYFAAPPEVGTAQANADGDIDITLTVEEKQTGQFRLGAGFSQLNRISGFIGLAETNFLGRGLTVGIDWEFSRTRQTVDLRFTEPWLWGTPTQLTLNIYNRVQDQVAQQFYDDRRRGGSVRIGRPFPWVDYTSIFWRYSNESIKLSNFSPLYSGPLRFTNWPQATSSTSLTLLRNSTDSPFRPSTGTRSSVTAELNGGFLGGDVTFQGYDAAFAMYQRLIGSLVLQLRFSGGVLVSDQQIGGVPEYELFRLGGNRRYAVRGYDFYSIVPRGNAPFIGGKFFNIVSYEVTLPIAPNIFILGFMDAGNTWNSFRESDLFDLRKGVGIGIRMELPMLGVMGFDYGYGYDKPFGGSWIPHLNLGGTF